MLLHKRPGGGVQGGDARAVWGCVQGAVGTGAAASRGGLKVVAPVAGAERVKRTGNEGVGETSIEAEGVGDNKF